MKDKVDEEKKDLSQGSTICILAVAVAYAFFQLMSCQWYLVITRGVPEYPPIIKEPVCDYFFCSPINSYGKYLY